MPVTGVRRGKAGDTGSGALGPLPYGNRRRVIGVRRAGGGPHRRGGGRGEPAGASRRPPPRTGRRAGPAGGARSGRGRRRGPDRTGSFDLANRVHAGGVEQACWSATPSAMPGIAAKSRPVGRTGPPRRNPGTGSSVRASLRWAEVGTHAAAPRSARCGDGDAAARGLFSSHIRVFAGNRRARERLPDIDWEHAGRPVRGLE